MTLLDQFSNYLQSLDCSPATVRGYLADLTIFSRWLERDLSTLTPADVEAYKQHLLVVERRKASTVNRRLAALSAYAKWAVTAGQSSSNPTVSVEFVKQVADVPRWLDKQEQFALLRAIERDLHLSKLRYPKRWVTRRRDASLTLFLLNTGLRLDELTAMRLGDVQISERKGSVLVQKGKGGKQRAIPLNAEARKALQRWLEIRPATDGDFVWTGVEGTSADLSGRAVQSVLLRYAQEAGLEELTPHTCRHTFAKNLVDQGVGLEKVAALLGHASLNTTRRYIASDTLDLERAVEKLH